MADYESGEEIGDAMVKTKNVVIQIEYEIHAYADEDIRKGGADPEFFDSKKEAMEAFEKYSVDPQIVYVELERARKKWRGDDDWRVLDDRQYETIAEHGVRPDID